MVAQARGVVSGTALVASLREWYNKRTALANVTNAGLMKTGVVGSPVGCCTRAMMMEKTVVARDVCARWRSQVWPCREGGVRLALLPVGVYSRGHSNMTGLPAGRTAVVARVARAGLRSSFTSFGERPFIGHAAIMTPNDTTRSILL